MDLIGVGAVQKSVVFAQVLAFFRKFLRVWVLGGGV